MGPPSLELLPPQPVEIDLNSSRTLPTPSPSSAVAWDSSYFPPPAFGDLSSAYGPSNSAKPQQLPLESPNKGTSQDPITQWYTGNDGPWIPKGISEGIAEERGPRAQVGNRTQLPFGSHYRPSNPSESGAFQFGVPHSDSGYGTRRSVENTSIFSADVTDRDQDCQSLVGHLGEYQPFSGVGEAMRDPRTIDTWPVPVASTIIQEPPSLTCPTCRQAVKTQSELKYGGRIRYEHVTKVRQEA